MSRFLWLLIEAHHMRQLLSGFFLQYNEKGGAVRKVGCKVAGRSRLIIGTKFCPGFFQQHRLLAKVLLLRWPFNIASMAKCYCFVGQVSNHASQPYFPSDPKKA